MAIAAGSCAAFEGEISVQLPVPENAHISPGVKDGIKDEIMLPIVVDDVNNLHVQGYKIRVHNENGNW